MKNVDLQYDDWHLPDPDKKFRERDPVGIIETYEYWIKNALKKVDISIPSFCVVRQNGNIEENIEDILYKDRITTYISPLQFQDIGFLEASMSLQKHNRNVHVIIKPELHTLFTAPLFESISPNIAKLCLKEHKKRKQNIRIEDARDLERHKDLFEFLTSFKNSQSFEELDVELSQNIQEIKVTKDVTSLNIAKHLYATCKQYPKFKKKLHNTIPDNIREYARNNQFLVYIGLFEIAFQLTELYHGHTTRIQTNANTAIFDLTKTLVQASTEKRQSWNKSIAPVVSKIKENSYQDILIDEEKNEYEAKFKKNFAIKKLALRAFISLSVLGTLGTTTLVAHQALKNAQLKERQDKTDSKLMLRQHYETAMKESDDMTESDTIIPFSATLQLLSHTLEARHPEWNSTILHDLEVLLEQHLRKNIRKSELLNRSPAYRNHFIDAFIQGKETYFTDRGLTLESPYQIINDNINLFKNIANHDFKSYESPSPLYTTGFRGITSPLYDIEHFEIPSSNNPTVYLQGTLYKSKNQSTQEKYLMLHDHYGRDMPKEIAKQTIISFLSESKIYDTSIQIPEHILNFIAEIPYYETLSDSGDFSIWKQDITEQGAQIYSYTEENYTFHYSFALIHKQGRVHLVARNNNTLHFGVSEMPFSTILGKVLSNRIKEIRQVVPPFGPLPNKIK